MRRLEKYQRIINRAYKAQRLGRLYCLIWCVCLLPINYSAYADCKLPPGFTYLSNIDNSIDQKISFATPDNCIGHRLRGYETRQAICTVALAKELKKVQKSLKKINPYYSLSVLDAYRPTDAVKDIIS